MEKEEWAVEEMPFENPGYDVKANKDNQEMYIEIKSHLRDSNNVDITIRQFKEYIKNKAGNENVHWELWNVENLSIDAEDVRIARYTEIPDEALMAREFKVDLRKCE